VAAMNNPENEAEKAMSAFERACRRYFPRMGLDDRANAIRRAVDIANQIEFGHQNSYYGAMREHP